MKTIEIPRGAVLVDDEDFEWLSQWKWWLSTDGYAIRRYTANGKRVAVWLHQQVHGADYDRSTHQIDHINRNKLDNRRSNLRLCTHAQNQFNTTCQKNNKLGVKGIHWNARTRKFVAQLKGGGAAYIRAFELLSEAREYYNRKAVEVYGEFARLN